MLLAAVSLLAAPAAGERAELEQPAVEQCSADADTGDHAPGDDHPDHEHHQHGCGSCHIHVLRAQATSLGERDVPAIRIAVFKDSDPALAVPSVLFRPPRA